MRIRRLTAILLCLCMAVTLLPAAAWAAEENDSFPPEVGAPISGETQPGEETQPEEEIQPSGQEGCVCGTLCAEGMVNDGCQVCLSDIGACEGQTPAPANALAPAADERGTDDTEPNIYVGGVGLTGTAADPAYATTSGGTVTPDGDEDTYNVKWDGETLTLRNAIITQGTRENAAIYRRYDSDTVTLMLEGTNQVTNERGDGIYFTGCSPAISSESSGSIEIKCSGYGIYSANSIYIMDGTVKISAGGYGFHASHAITISGGTVAASGGTEAAGIRLVRVEPPDGKNITVQYGASEDNTSTYICSKEETISQYVDGSKYIHTQVTEPTGQEQPEDNIVVGGVGLYGGEGTVAYAVTSDEGVVTAQGADKDTYNVKWDGETLTLRNATIHSAYGIHRDGDLRLMLEGANSIQATSYGVYGYGDNLTISGDNGGSIKIWCYTSGNSKCGIRYIGNIEIVSGTVDIDIDNGGNGIYAGDILMISGGTVTTVGGHYGICSEERITITGGNVTTGSGNSGIYAIPGADIIISGGELTATGELYGAIYIEEPADSIVTIAPASEQQIAVTAGDDADRAKAIDGSPFTSFYENITEAVSGAKYFHSYTEDVPPVPEEPKYEIYVGGVGLTGTVENPAYATTSGGTVRLDGNADNYNIKWDGTTLTLDDATISDGYSFSSEWESGSAAIYYHQDSNLSIELVGDNTVTSPGGNAIQSSYGIYAYGCDDDANLTISGSGSLTATGGDGVVYSYGIYGDNIIINSGTVIATGGESEEDSFGIDTFDITITGGTVTAKGTASKRISAGVATMDFAISGGQIIAAGDDGAQWSYGIYASEIIISGGEVTAEGGSKAITQIQVIIRPTSGQRIEVLSGESKAVATEIEGSPFASEKIITDLVSSTAKYFHSKAVEGGAPGPDEFTISFDGSGGTVPTPQTTVNGRLTSLPTPTRDGYDFLGWYTASGDRVTTDTVFAADTTLYPLWDRRDSGSSGRPYRPVTPSESDSPSTGDSDGWNDIREEVGDAKEGDTITIDMNGETEVPREIFETVAGKDVTVELDMGSGMTWSINGQDVPDGVRLSDLDLSVSMDTSEISADVINAVTGGYGAVQVSLAHDGEFGFALTLTVPLGRGNAGYWANLYRYDERAEQLIFETCARIVEDGTAALPMTYASQYTIVIDDHSHDPALELPFTDVPEGAWYCDAVAYVYANGLMNGTSETAFSPDAATTRAMIWTILARLNGQNVDGGSPWYALAQSWAVSANVSDGTNPTGNITREELAAMLYRAVGSPDVSGNFLVYADGDSVSAWAENAMLWTTQNGIIDGIDGMLTPQGQATRAQVATMLMRFCKAI